MNNTDSAQEETFSDFFAPNSKKIELLQSILQTEQGNEVSFEDAEEIGIQLITLYECLARDKTILRDLHNEVT